MRGGRRDGLGVAVAWANTGLRVSDKRRNRRFDTVSGGLARVVY